MKWVWVEVYGSSTVWFPNDCLIDQFSIETDEKRALLLTSICTMHFDIRTNRDEVIIPVPTLQHVIV